jgi:hypothetical protein
MAMKIDFEFTTQYGVFRDALYLEDEHGLSEDEINAMKQERLDNWMNSINNPQQPDYEVVEVDGVLYKKQNLNGQTVLLPLEL